MIVYPISCLMKGRMACTTPTFWRTPLPRVSVGPRLPPRPLRRVRWSSVCLRPPAPSPMQGRAAGMPCHLFTGLAARLVGPANWHLPQGAALSIPPCRHHSSPEAGSLAYPRQICCFVSSWVPAPGQLCRLAYSLGCSPWLTDRPAGLRVDL